VERVFTSGFVLGILGGGQLGRMMLPVLQEWNIRTIIMDPSPHAPCSHAAGFTTGDFRSYDDVLHFGKQCDVLTVEIEHVNVRALKDLEQSGVKVFPQARILETVQDKAAQKDFYHRHGIPSAAYRKYATLREMRENPPSYPFIWKAARSGYDGRGVQLIEDASQLSALPERACIAEEYLDIYREFSVLISRNRKGETAVYPPVEMQFHPQVHQLEYVFAPARVDTKLARRLEELALRTSGAFGHVGLMAVEMIETKDGMIRVNEVAPRPHNSGHYSMDASYTGQFEQHLRAILNLSPGDTGSRMPAVMLNLTGEEFYSGEVVYSGLEKALENPRTYLHLYGKTHTRPHRKMGHLTVLHDDINEAYRLAKEIGRGIRITGREQMSCD